MNNKRYLIETFVLASFISPLLLGLPVLFATLFWALLFVPLIFGVVVWVWRITKWNNVPDEAGIRYLPVVLAFCYYMVLWVLALIVTDGNFENIFIDSPFFSFIFLPYRFVLPFIGGENMMWFPFFLIGFYGFICLIMVLASDIRTRPKSNKKLYIPIGLYLLFSVFGISWYCDYRVIPLLPFDQVKEDIISIRNNKVRFTSLDERATLSIESDHPRLSGTVVVYPLCRSMQEMLYRGEGYVSSADKYANCWNNPSHYHQLINGSLDAFFGVYPMSPEDMELLCQGNMVPSFRMYPSKGQIAMSKKVGRQFVFTPIAKDAFVFFVNKKNPVSSLTSNQIRGIYLKTITNWYSVGGGLRQITPFQRSDNSDSQAAMMSMVMKGLKLPNPPKEEELRPYGTYTRVADYRNYSGAIGYSTRFYTTAMKQDAQIKLLAVNGIEPTYDNIKDGSYPFTTFLYAVTTAQETPNTKKLIDWLLSEQGQRLVEECGYVPLK